MQTGLITLAVVAALGACIGRQDNEPVSGTARLTASASPLALITVVGVDTLSDSASIHQLEPEPDGGSIAFLFADPAKGIRRGLGLITTTANPTSQLAWPDSVDSFWWSGPHQLSFTAGTGQGVRVVVDAHAAQLEALQVTDSQAARRSTSRPFGQADSAARAHAQRFIDSVRVQPGGAPQQSALRYEADSIILAEGDTLAAAHVSAANNQGGRANPAWYIVHLPSGGVYPIDSLTGTSSGLPPSAAHWGPGATFYYAKDRTIWRAQAKVEK